MNKNGWLNRAIFHAVRGAVRLVYPKTTVEGTENLPAGEGCVVVGNHTQMNGPIIGEIYFPGPRRTWCASEMMELKEVPGYAFQDFWSQKPKRVRWFFRLLSYIIPPLAVAVFNNALTIPVYRDARIVSTFRRTMESLKAGENVIIFPEYDKKYNHILYDFQSQFIDVAYFVWKQTGTRLAFVPMYIAPRLRRVVLGPPIRFDGAQPIAKERERIKTYLMDEITRIAEALPEHTVIPYRNIPRKEYPSSRPGKGGEK